ncbi:MAG: hypothetical protein CL677_02925 [Bdellovibrionaceae bacterium]|nr:hypothetical protein [Pseudobdellovibrionaceae bacterium]|tara:strand:+ start:70998 stop:71546 length:549 start_codon:yes stop_codon:yes gene_type:complete
MEPRLKESTKWTELPEELVTQVIEALSESFSKPAKVGKFFCEGRIYKSEILVRLGYLANGRLVQANAEASIEFDFQKEKAQDIIGLAVDACGSLLDNYFQNPDEDFPREWKPFDFEGKQIFLQFTTDNSELEAEADKLLGIEAEDGLVQGDADSETIEAIQKSLGVDEDEDPGNGNSGNTVH